MTEDLNVLRCRMRAYINNALSGSEITKLVDDFVSSDRVHNLPEGLYEKVMALQNEVAFYVSDAETRKEYSSYFGDDRLKFLIERFLKETGMS